MSDTESKGDTDLQKKRIFFNTELEMFRNVHHSIRYSEMFNTESVMIRSVKIEINWYSFEHRWKRKLICINAENDWISMRAQPVQSNKPIKYRLFDVVLVSETATFISIHSTAEV